MRVSVVLLCTGCVCVCVLVCVCAVVSLLLWRGCGRGFRGGGERGAAPQKGSATRRQQPRPVACAAPNCSPRPAPLAGAYRCRSASLLRGRRGVRQRLRSVSFPRHRVTACTAAAARPPRERTRRAERLDGKESSEADVGCAGDDAHDDGRDSAVVAIRIPPPPAVPLSLCERARRRFDVTRIRLSRATRATRRRMIASPPSSHSCPVSRCCCCCLFAVRASLSALVVAGVAFWLRLFVRLLVAVRWPLGMPLGAALSFSCDRRFAEGRRATTERPTLIHHKGQTWTNRAERIEERRKNSRR